jgi:hypothetical protein
MFRPVSSFSGLTTNGLRLGSAATQAPGFRANSQSFQRCLGNPAVEHISTSYIEPQNLTMRMSMRRFTRLTNGHSKKARTTSTRWHCTTTSTVCRVSTGELAKRAKDVSSGLLKIEKSGDAQLSTWPVFARRISRSWARVAGSVHAISQGMQNIATTL